jgi:predicted GIY-YIG superfamily endonuclease
MPRRAYEHREGLIAGFSARYSCKLLVWYEVHETMEYAIAREADQRRFENKETGADRSNEPAMARPL